jgi:hypothetical protein
MESSPFWSSADRYLREKASIRRIGRGAGTMRLPFSIRHYALRAFFAVFVPLWLVSRIIELHGTVWLVWHLAIPGVVAFCCCHQISDGKLGHQWFASRAARWLRALGFGPTGITPARRRRAVVIQGRAWAPRRSPQAEVGKAPPLVGEAV